MMESADASSKLARWPLFLLELDLEGVHRAGIKHQTLDILSRLNTERNDTTNLNKVLPVLVIDEAENQQDVESEYFDQDHPGNGKADNQTDSHGEDPKPPTLRELLDAQANDPYAPRQH